MGIGEVLKVSVRRLKDNYKNVILTFLAFLVINIGLGVASALLSLLFGAVPVIRFLVPIIYVAFTIIELPMSNAYLKQIIKASDGEDVNAFGFTQDIKGLFIVSWKVAFYTLLKYLAPICIGLVSLILIATNISSLALIGSIGYVVAAVLNIIIMLDYAFVNNELIYDNGNSTPKQIVENTAMYMKGNKGNLFSIYLIVFAISLILSALISVPVLGIVSILAMYFIFLPYALVLVVTFYESIRGILKDNDNSMEERINQVIENESNNQDGPITEAKMDENIDSSPIQQ